MSSLGAPPMAQQQDGGGGGGNDNAADIVVVPTLPDQVRAALRQRGEPVRLFGENLMNVRERLRQVLIDEQQGGGGVSVKAEYQQQQEQEELQTTTQYTRASSALVQARQIMCQYSLTKAKCRLDKERQLRREATVVAEVARKERKKRKMAGGAFVADDDDVKKQSVPSGAAARSSENVNNSDTPRQLLDDVDSTCRRAYRSAHGMALEASQYGDRRALSSLCCTRLPTITSTTSSSNDDVVNKDDKKSQNENDVPVVVTASWTASIHVWNLEEIRVPSNAEGGVGGAGENDDDDDGGDQTILVPPLSNVGQKTQCHEDRIMGLAVHRPEYGGPGGSPKALVVTTSLDTTAKLWTLSPAERTKVSSEKKEGSDSILYRIDEQHHLRGHSARTCRAAFHPAGRHFATTSADHTWRMWDVETGDCLLLQDGHADVVYGIDAHPDGGLLATTDFAGVVHVWDLRTGQSVWTCVGHAGRVLNAAFHPANGFQLATAGDDGTIQVWDLRRRRPRQQQQRQKRGSGEGSNAAYHTAAAVSIPAHNNLITNLRFDKSTDGEILASSSFDGTVKLWSCRSWKLLNDLHGHQGKVTSVDFLPPSLPSAAAFGGDKSSRPGLGVVTCGFDKTVKLWK